MPDTVYIVIAGDDVEVFDERPITPAEGGAPGNWPDAFKVYAANVNGGDSELLEWVRPARTTVARPFIEIRQKRVQDLREGDVVRLSPHPGSTGNWWGWIAGTSETDGDHHNLPRYATRKMLTDIERNNQEFRRLYSADDSSWVDASDEDAVDLTMDLAEGDVVLRIIKDHHGLPNETDDEVWLFRNPYFLVDVQVEITPSIP